MASRKTENEPINTGGEIAPTQEQQPNPVEKLPPEHVDHAAVYYNEHTIRKQGFEVGLSAIDAEISGKKIEREEKIAAIERDYISDMASLERRRTMMVIGIEMAGAALAKFDEMNAKEQENAAPAIHETQQQETDQD